MLYSGWFGILSYVTAQDAWRCENGELMSEYLLGHESNRLEKMANQADIVIEQLRNMGIRVIERFGMYQKIAVLDNRILWEGSLNILSHRDSGEQMRRFECSTSIEEIVKNLELDDNMAVGNQNGEKCPGSRRNPKCEGYVVVRSNRGRKFFGCSNYPQCDYTRPIGGHSTKFQSEYRRDCEKKKRISYSE